MANESILYQAAKTYVRAAMSLLADTVPKAPPQISPGLRGWVRSGNVFVTRDLEIPHWSRGIWSKYEVLHSLGEYKLYVQALEKDPASARYIGMVYTSRGGGRQITAEELADRLLWRMAERRGGFEFDATDFDVLFGQFEADLLRDSIDYVVVAPLPGFTSDLDSIPLGSGLELAELSDDELSRCLRISIYPGIDLGGIVHATKTYGLRCRFSEKKFFGHLPPDETRSAQGAHQERVDLFFRVLHALRLFKRGTVSIPGIATFSDQWPLEAGVSGFSIDPGSARGNSYELAAHERETFEELWRALNGSPLARFLETAIRRFAYAVERRRPEDRCVDLLISAESLFLSDTAEARERGELRYRLALRSAFFVQLDNYSRKELYRFMRNAYDARSAVVHGGLPDDTVLKLPQKGKVSLSEFVDFTEDVLRVALLKAVKTQPVDKMTLVDWDSLILG